MIEAYVDDATERFAFRNGEKGIHLTIRAREESFISKERIERCLAGLYKSIKYSNEYLSLEKRIENDIVTEITMVVTVTKLLEVEELIRNFVDEIFECDEVEDVLEIIYEGGECS